MDRVAPATAAILQDPDLFALQRWVCIDHVFVEELSVDLPCAIPSFKPEGAGFCLGNCRRKLRVGIGQVTKMDAKLWCGGYCQPRIAWITSHERLHVDLDNGRPRIENLAGRPTTVHLFQLVDKKQLSQ